MNTSHYFTEENYPYHIFIDQELQYLPKISVFCQKMPFFYTFSVLLKKRNKGKKQGNELMKISLKIKTWPLHKDKTVKVFA